MIKEQNAANAQAKVNFLDPNGNGEKANESDSMKEESDSSDASNNLSMRKPKVLKPEDCRILRDTKNNFEPVERFFGTLRKGDAFGESFMLGGSHNNRFFNAYALRDVTLLRLDKDKYDEAMGAAERKIFLDKKGFIISLPEFKEYSLSNAKSKAFCA